MTSFEKFQKQLLAQSRYIFWDKPLSQATEKAYWATPRHLFVKRYRLWGNQEWNEIDDHNLEQHLAILYHDRALILFGDDDDNIPSTISQPSLVLYMLDMLQLEPGHTVLELGAGSGWNAALLGHLVGSEGQVYSLEIIPELAQTATETIEALGIENTQIIAADGGEGYATGAPYDRAIFTAGAYDLPRHFYEQIKEGGLLLIVIKNEGGGDTLFLLQKKENHFESLDSLPCGFVQMTGKYQLDSLKPITLETLPDWPALQTKELSSSPFWWGGKGKEGFRWRTLGIRSFLGITEPRFRAFKSEKSDEQSYEEHFFGLWDEPNQALVIAKDDQLITYGHPAARERLLAATRRWVDLGMPSAASFKLRIYPLDAPLVAGEKQWLVKREESQFLWGLEI